MAEYISNLAVKHMEPSADTSWGEKYWNKRLEVRLPSADRSLLGGKPLRTYHGVNEEETINESGY